MLSNDIEAPLADIRYLVRSEHRVRMLAALSERPQSRDDLRSLTGASRSTVGRTLSEFEARRWIRRAGHEFRATPLGGYVAAGVEELLERFETEWALRDVWRWLPPEASGFTVEMATSSVVTRAGAEDPYAPVNRFGDLLAAADRFRFVGFDVALLEPWKDRLADRILDGMDAEIVDPPSVARYVLSTHREHCSRPLESGNLAVRLHDDLPAYGIGLFDERIAVSGSSPDSGAVKVLLDTDAPDAREWADATYESYRREARPLEPDRIAQ